MPLSRLFHILIDAKYNFLNHLAGVMGVVPLSSNYLYVTYTWLRHSPGTRNNLKKKSILLIVKGILVWYQTTNIKLTYIREGFNKKNIKSYDIFHPNLPPPPLWWNKNIFFHNFFLCLYYVYYHQSWRELWRKNSYLLHLKCLEPKSWSQKVWLTAVISALTPPSNEKLKSSLFWMN